MTAAAATLAAAAAAFAAGQSVRPGHRRLRLAPTTSARRALLTVLGVVIGVAGWTVGLPPAGVLAAAPVWAGARHLRRRARRRRAREARDQDVVLLCFALASELRAGRTATDALAGAAAQLRALGPGLAAAARAVGHGASVHEELRSLADIERCRRLLPVASVWAATEATGARCADVLQRLGRTLAEDDEAAAELDALCAGPRATAWVLSVLPGFGLVLGTAIGASPLSVLLHTRLGLGLIVGGIALDGAGLAWVRRITASALVA